MRTRESTRDPASHPGPVGRLRCSRVTGVPLVALRSALDRYLSSFNGLQDGGGGRRNRHPEERRGSK